MYEIVIDEPLSGKILFEGRKLQMQKFIHQPPVIIKPHTEESVWIQQELSDEEVGIIYDAVKFHNEKIETYYEEMPEGYQFNKREWAKGKLSYPPEFELKGLKFTIKSASQVKTKLLTQMGDVRASIDTYERFR